jgi:hypothetical protein
MATALLHPHDTDTAHPVLASLGALEEALDQLNTRAVNPLKSGTYAAVVLRIERASRRLEAVKLKVLASADRAGTAADAGFTGTDAWVARTTTVTRTTAARQVGLARELGTGGHDATTTALDAGLLSPAHAAVIVRAGAQLPAGVSDSQRRQVEAALVEQARRFDPDQLRREARRALAAVEPDQQAVDAHENELVRSEQETARDKTRLSLHDNGDGSVTGHFTVPALAAAVLGKVIESMTAPRRMPALDKPYDWDHRRGLAFTELLEHLPTDHLHPKSAATVVVTIDHLTLQGALKAARLDTGEALTAGEARRLACNAGLVPAVLGTGSVALDLGRETRLFSQAQRLAAGLRHDTCAADGCDRPYAWCELHHRSPWSKGGRTNLDNAIPLCHRHHQWIHDTAYCHRRMPDGSIRFNRRT